MFKMSHFFVGLLCLVQISCGKGVSGDPQGKMTLVVKAVSTSAAHSMVQESLIHTLLANNASVGSIFSGPPTTMTVKLLSITGTLKDNSTRTFWTSPTSGGTAVALSSGTVDISTLGLTNLTVTAGDYTKLKVTFGGIATVNGCVTGTYGQTISSASGSVSNGGSTSSSYQGTFTNEACTSGTTVTYCTQAALTEVGANVYNNTPIAANTAYLATPATDSQVYLSRSSVSGVWSGTLDVENDVAYTIPTGTTPATITMAVDMNRLLRFYSNTRSDRQPPNPDMKAGTSYFFTTIFPDSIQFFPTQIGSVEGYEVTVTGTSGTCTGSSVYEWITLFKDASAAVTGILISPDDDDALTVAKGGGIHISGDTTNGLTFTAGISGGVFSGFTSLSAVGVSGTATLTMPTGAQCAGSVFSVAYTRRL